MPSRTICGQRLTSHQSNARPASRDDAHIVLDGEQLLNAEIGSSRHGVVGTEMIRGWRKSNGNGEVRNWMRFGDDGNVVMMAKLGMTYRLRQVHFFQDELALPIFLFAFCQQNVKLGTILKDYSDETLIFFNARYLRTCWNKFQQHYWHFVSLASAVSNEAISCFAQRRQATNGRCKQSA